MGKKTWPAEESVFVAVRKTARHTYLDTTTTSGALDRTRQLAAQDDEELKAWAKDNPVVGYASCRVVVDDVILP